MLNIYNTDLKTNKFEKIKEFKPGSWISLVNPSEEEIKTVCKNLKIEDEFIKYPLDYEEQARIDVDDDMTLFVIGMLLVIFLEVFNAIQCGFLGIILGHKKNNKKTGFSVLYGFIFYLVSQVLIVILIFTVGLFTSGVMDLFKTNAQISPDSFKLLIVLAIIFYLFITWIISMICKEKLRDGVNIE